jgi:hypothetical protein
MALVLGVASWALAIEKQQMEVLNQPLKLQAERLGTKDVCWLWMHELYTLGWSASWWSDFDSCCGFKQLIDPYGDLIGRPGYTDCAGEIFPFNVESFSIILWYYNGASDTEYADLVWECDIETLAVDLSGGCGAIPGGEIWNSGPITSTIWDDGVPTDSVGYVSGFFVGVEFDTSIWVYEPFFVSWHLLNHPWAEIPFYCYWGWGSDAAVPDTCLNWMNGGCIGYPFWFEWYNFWGAPQPGNVIIEVDGKPWWNVAVDMGSFEAVPGDRMVTLNWQSLSETNNSHWIVSRDGEKIAQLEGQGSKETPTDYRYVDRNVAESMTYSYTLEAVNFEGISKAYGPVTATVGTVPLEFSLAQNYPNPFNASTVIRYELAEKEHVTLKVFNVSGQEVASLVDEVQKAGRYTVQWTGKGISSGVYLYTLTAGDFSETKKMVFMK